MTPSDCYYLQNACAFGGIAAAAGVAVWVHCRRAAAVSVLQLPLDLGIRRGCPIEKPVDLRVNALTLSKGRKEKKIALRYNLGSIN